MVEHIVYTITSEGTTRDTIDIILSLRLGSCLDDSDACELPFTEELLALKFSSEVWCGDFGTKTWGFSSVTEVSTFDRRVIFGIDS